MRFLTTILFHSTAKGFTLFLLAYTVCLNAQHTPEGIKQARLYQLKGQYEQTDSLYRQAFDTLNQNVYSPDSIGLWHAEWARATTESDRYSEAIARLDSVCSVFSSLDNPPLFGLGTIYYRQANIKIFTEQLELAEEDLKSAITYFKQMTDQPEIALAKVWGTHSHIQFRKKNIDSAFHYSHRALDVLKAANATDTESAISILNSLGVLHHARDENKQALAYYRKTYRVMKNIYDPAHPNLGILLNNTGALFLDLNQIDSAEYCFKKVLQINERHGSKRTRIMAYYNISAFYLRRGDYEQAKTYIQGAEQLALDYFGPNHPFVALIYTALSGFYGDLSQHLLAIDYTRKAVDIRSKLLDPTHEDLLSNYYSLGTIYYNQGKYRASVDAMREITLWNHQHNKRSATLGHLEAQLGDAYIALGKLDSAEYFLHQSLISYEATLPTDHPYISWCYNLLSSISSKRGQWEEAFKLSDRAFRLHHPEHKAPGLGDKWPTPKEYTEFYYIQDLCLNRAQIHLDRYRATDEYAALDRAEQVLYHLQDIFSHRESLLIGKVNEDLNAESWRRLYEKLFQVFKMRYRRTGDDRFLASMWELADKGKSKLFKWTVRNESAIQFAGVPDSLLQSEMVLRKQISELENELLLAGERLQSVQTNQLIDLKEEYSQLLQYFSKNYPEYFKLKYAEDPPVSLDQLQLYAAREQTILIEFAFVEHDLFAFVASRDTVFMYRYPRDQLDLLQVDTVYQKLKDDKTGYRKWAMETGELLLSPLQQILPEEGTLTIIPDRQLTFIPFDALILPNNESYLVEHFSLRFKMFLPTTEPDQLREERLEYHTPLLAVAPGFEDELKQEHLRSVKDSLMADRQYLGLLRQPWAIEFAGSLADLWRGEALTGAEATESKVKEELSSSYIFHLGTHAFLNKKFPLHSRFVLSKEHGKTGEDGYMHLYELYNMKCPAKLAVLTACQTGRGHWKSGEGVQSLAVAFRYMGVPSVIMSLWSIDEAASHDIVNRFYNKLKTGHPKDLALQEAKQDYIRKHPSTHPFYWAGLILIGDAAPINKDVLGSSVFSGWPGRILIILLFGVIVYLVIRKTSP